MFWVIFVIVVILFAMLMDSEVGKLAVGLGIAAIGLLLLKWITGWGFFVVLAKICAVLLVLIVIGVVLMNLFGD